MKSVSVGPVKWSIYRDQFITIKAYEMISPLSKSCKWWLIRGPPKAFGRCTTESEKKDWHGTTNEFTVCTNYWNSIWSVKASEGSLHAYCNPFKQLIISMQVGLWILWVMRCCQEESSGHSILWMTTTGRRWASKLILPCQQNGLWEYWNRSQIGEAYPSVSV